MKEKKTDIAFNVVNRIGTWEDQVEMYQHPDCPVDILLEGAQKWSQIDAYTWSPDANKVDQDKKLYSSQAISAILKNPNVTQEILEIIQKAGKHSTSLKLKTHPYSPEVRDHMKDLVISLSQGVYDLVNKIYNMDRLFLSGSSMVYLLNSALGKSWTVVKSGAFEHPDFNDFVKKSEVSVLKDFDFFFKTNHDRTEFVNLLMMHFVPRKSEDIEYSFSFSDGKIETKNAAFIPGEFKFGTTVLNGGISKNAISIKNCQFIIRSVGTPEEIVSDFDFYHCQAYFDFSENKVNFPAKFLRSLKTAKLLYNSSCATYPVNTLQRATKFAARGWVLPKYQLLKIISKMLSKDINDGLADNLDGYYSEVQLDSDITDFNDLIAKVRDQMYDIEQD